MQTVSLLFFLLSATTSGLRLQKAKPRHVYFDLGANWANTLRLYKDLADPVKVHQQPWEVYAFEASPLIVPYLDKFVTYLNGEGNKPKLLWPPTGSSEHLKQYSKRYGCNDSTPKLPKGMHTCSGCTEADRILYHCMLEKFKEPLKKMKADTTLMTLDVIHSRMAKAKIPPSDDKDRFVLIPAGAGAEEGTLHLGEADPEVMIMGGAIDNRHSGKEYDVPVADFVSMLVNNFREEDYIIVKMDIEGAEHAIIKKLIEQKKNGLIDVLAFECHAFAGDCKKFPTKARNVAGKVLKEFWPKDHTKAWPAGRYEGIDSYSTPDKYYPEDPDVHQG